MTAPTARYLALGARVQSSTLLLLALQSRIRPFDAAIIADTVWEPAAVYTHLDRLQRLAAAGGIPIIRVATDVLSRSSNRRDVIAGRCITGHQPSPGPNSQ